MTKLLYRLSSRVFLVLAVVIALLPFLDLRVLRMAGDEKVYVSQSIEMAQRGAWFTHTLADVPDYYKGPLHYLFVRTGMIVFGDHLIAGTWMNLALALLAGLAMYRFGRKRWDDKTGLLLGLATGLNVGVFSHALASQMEVEVFAFYAFATAALGLAKEKPTTGKEYLHDFMFWVAAGLAGWAKSPLHSVLIGMGGIVYWTWTRQLTWRLRSPMAWLAVISGVVLCGLGYLPAFILDRENFVNTYLLREQLEKVNNQHSWTYVVKPLFYFLLPWTFIVLGGVWHLIKRRVAASKSKATGLPTLPGASQASVDSGMVKLGLSVSLPTILFWSFWTYKGQNYNLPAMPGLLVFGFACFSGKFPRAVFSLAGALGVLALGFMLGIVMHFWPLPEWWTLGWLVVAAIAMAVYGIAFLATDDFRWIGIGAMAMFVAFGAFITPLGEREMKDARQFIHDHPGVTLHYYNLDPNIWSEWGLLQLSLHKRVKGLHRPQQLVEATKPGNAIIVMNTDWLNRIMNYWRNSNAPDKSKTPVVVPWARWLTKGKAQDGSPRWKSAWMGKDLRQLEREFYIIWFPEPAATAATQTLTPVTAPAE